MNSLQRPSLIYCRRIVLAFSLKFGVSLSAAVHLYPIVDFITAALDVRESAVVYKAAVAEAAAAAAEEE